MRERVETFMRNLQDEICEGLEALDGSGKFHQDLWERRDGGGGRTRIIQGEIIEKGGVNFSAVHGPMPEKIKSALKIPSQQFFATGVSIVLHPKSPMVPIIHMNVRFFDTDSGHSWFGGGIDLTPHYIVEEDALFFHQKLKEVCDSHHDSYYPQFKKWADDYFYLKHRNETRGIGGIFFDRLSESAGFSMEDRFAFTKDVGKAFVPIYSELVKRNVNKEYSSREKDWQYHRRGRYVEFNLVWDKGTKFGLDTNGRTESILMSLPPQARWTYEHKVVAGSKEEQTLNLLKKEIDWINYKVR